MQECVGANQLTKETARKSFWKRVQKCDELSMRVTDRLKVKKKSAEVCRCESINGRDKTDGVLESVQKCDELVCV